MHRARAHVMLLLAIKVQHCTALCVLHALDTRLYHQRLFVHIGYIGHHTLQYRSDIYFTHPLFVNHSLCNPTRAR